MKGLLALLTLLLVAVPALAVEESEAPTLDPRVAAVGHNPTVVEPGTQWDGFIRFHDGHNITAVRYQICKVGLSCFAGPALATQVDDNTWRFNTQNYTVIGRLVEWGINEPGEGDVDWRVGVQYVLFADGADSSQPYGGQFFPHGVEIESDACEEMGWQACSETHYVAFDMEGRERAGKDVPAPFILLPLLGALVLARRQ